MISFFHSLHCILFGHLQLLFFLSLILLKASIYIWKGGIFVWLPLTYLATAMQEGQGSQQDRHLVRKTLKSALSHLKADHAGDFLSCHGQRVREYVPDLAESIAGLILSSNDKEFQDECVTLLGLGSDQDVSEGLVQSSICEKMIHIIALNDTKENVDDNAPYLFECEKLDEEDGDEDMIFDF